MKIAYIVLGAQRSGTSATSHLLSQLNINFGRDSRFLQADHNPIFFELMTVNAFNNRVIQALNHQYTDFFLPIESDFETLEVRSFEPQLERLLQQEWGDTRSTQTSQLDTIGIKDPRISLTFPLWERVLQRCNYEIRVILPFRHPANFLRSNQRLFHNWEGWTEIRHLNFWLQLNLAAIYFCRHQPLYLLNYDALVQDPIAEIIQLIEFFALDPHYVEAASQVIQARYAHHQCDRPTNYPFVDQCYQRLQERSLSPDDYLQLRHMNRYTNDNPVVAEQRT